MTIITANFDTIASGADSGSVEFWSDPVRISSSGASVITPTVVTVSIVNGSMTTPSLDPGPARVRMQIGNWRDTYDIMVPNSGPIDLMQLLEQYKQYPASVVSSAWTAERAAEAARDVAQYSATAAASAATAAAQSAAVAEGVAGVGPATTSAPGLVQLSGDLGGTATNPTVPALSSKAPVANPTFTGTVTTPALKVTGGTPAAGNVLTSDSSGNATWQAGTTVPNATSSVPGLVQLTGDLGGTATTPTVPALAGKAPINSPTFVGTTTLPSVLIQAGTIAAGNVLTSDSAGYGSWQPLPTPTVGAALAFILGG
jgi:hypothetical protein